jgi:hypothetical protein
LIQINPFDTKLTMIKLTETERNIIEALDGKALTLEKLAAKAGYEVSGHFRRSITSLIRREILGNKRPGYFVQPPYQRLVNGEIVGRNKKAPEETRA